MRRAALLAATILAAATSAAVRADEAAFRTLTYRPETAPGAPAPTEKVLAQAAARLVDRWRFLHVDDVTAHVATTGDRVFVVIPTRSAKREALVRRMTETRGLVEFRVRADLKFEQEWAAKVERYAAVPPEHAWVPMEPSAKDPRKVLVETPPGDAQFTNADLASASVHMVPC